MKGESEKSGFRLNAKKTKVMVTLDELGEFTTADETCEVLDIFTFLGTGIDREGGCASESARMISMGKAAMHVSYWLLCLIGMKIR